MKYTEEMRWFVPGRAPRDVRAAFTGNVQERTDRYLSHPLAANIGIKIRQGKIEVKHPIRQGGWRVPWRNGWIEKWCKWSFPLEHQGAGQVVSRHPADGEQVPVHSGNAADATGKTQRTGPESSEWIEVVKARRTRVFQVDTGGSIRETGPAAHFPAGEPLAWCEVELAGIHVPGSQVSGKTHGLGQWWSLCFEITGSGGHDGKGLTALLRGVVERLELVIREPSLRRDRSCGYPAWLFSLRTRP
jgi:hypothetical protein